jgi:hypothetical protein
VRLFTRQGDDLVSSAIRIVQAALRVRNRGEMLKRSIDEQDAPEISPAPFRQAAK